MASRKKKAALKICVLPMCGMEHLVGILRLRKLTRVFVTMDSVVGEFRIDQRTSHFERGSNADGG